MKYGIFLNTINIYNDFFSFDFHKKEWTEKNQVIIDNFDNCIVYGINHFACDCMYNTNSIKYIKLYKLQNKLFYMIKHYREGKTKELIDFCNKKEITLKDKQ